MKDKLQELYNRYPKCIGKKLKLSENQDLHKWVIDQTNHLESLTIKDRVITILYPPKICPHGKEIKHERKFCGAPQNCQCHCDSIKKNNPMYNEEAKKKLKETNLEKYGYENAAQSKIVQEKKKKTILKKYGVSHQMYIQEVKDKIKVTNQIRYGCDNPSQSGIIKEKKKKTMQQNWGVDNPFQSEEIMKIAREKAKETSLKNYGTDIPSKSDIVKDKIRNTMLDRYGVAYTSQVSLGKEIVSKLQDKNWLEENLCNYQPKEIANILGCSCATIYNYIRAYKLYNPHQFRSIKEEEIVKYIKSLGFELKTNIKYIIPPYELDIYLPDINIAFEFNGSYWHTEKNGKDRKYHLNKTELCNKKVISLIHIWEHEWENNQTLIESRIKSLLGKNNTIYARKTELRNVTIKEARVFLNNNHAQGYCNSNIAYGLYYNREIVAIMSFGKSRFNKKYNWELLRYCSKQGVNIVGGASKLFKRFINDYNPAKIISYSDRMRNKGQLYEKLGFEYLYSSEPAYYYTKDYLNFENRIAYQKHKLKDKLDIFDPALTEWENMQVNGYDRIWDCGNDVWLYNKK